MASTSTAGGGSGKKNIRSGSGGNSNVNSSNSSNNDVSSSSSSSLSKSSSSSLVSLSLQNQVSMVVGCIYMAMLAQAFYMVCREAFEIRLYAIKEYGRVIHEFDPYFNYRATEYLWANGWKAFRYWYDNQVWYPLGRPVGTTIYPGMQVTAVAIKSYILKDWSINDICCFIPAWFGVLATIATALLTYECVGQGQQYPPLKDPSSGNTPKQIQDPQKQQPYESMLRNVPIVSYLYIKLIRPVVYGLFGHMEHYIGTTWGLCPRTTSTPGFECALFAAAIMSIVPAHILRSVGGGYDNESVATTAMVFTFFSWARSLRNITIQTPRHPLLMVSFSTIFWAFITAFAYFNMVAAWGGYVFVLNLIGVHASLLVIFGRFSSKLYYAYTIFYLLGTYLATRVPVVNMTPLKSLEQLGPMVTFIAYQLLQFAEIILYHRRQYTKSHPNYYRWKYRIILFTSCFLFLFLFIWLILAPTGYFGPVSSRVRGLFVKHTKTGNPLVDSVAEHQAASTEAYYQYLNRVIFVAPIGMGLVVLQYFNDASSFLVVYGVAAYFFSHRMVRLILLTAPIASVLGGIAMGYIWSWMLGSIFTHQPSCTALFREYILTTKQQSLESTDNDHNHNNNNNSNNTSKGKKNKKNKTTIPTTTTSSKGDPILVRIIRAAASGYILWSVQDYFKEFYSLSHDMAKGMSHPTIIAKARTHAGDEVLIDDYREAYFWLRDNTPHDARVMAWWDYGYQITGISNRTTIADGNTWNHEHIALLGRTLTAPEKEGHRIARHLADYILVWAGGGGDDLAKSPHLIRIANSVYRGLCSEPTCRSFGFYSEGVPTPQLENSMLYKLHSHKLKPGVEADRNRFKIVFHSKYGKVRIYKILKVSKESKEWVKDPKNRICDEGGWLCRGQYPPALQKVLKQKKDFQQLEDFNKNEGDDSEYQRQYMENLMNKNAGQQPLKKNKKKLSLQEIEALNQKREDNQYTTLLWQYISGGKIYELIQLLNEQPAFAHLRSADGRGPMWWAYEYNQMKVVELLKKHGVSDMRTDDDGVKAIDLKQ